MTTDGILKDRRAAYFTLGCKLNFAETSTIAQHLAAEGVRVARRGEKADVCIVNTCSVTEVADHKCRQAIHKLVRQHPGAFVVVTGCYAQLKSQEVAAIPGVSLVLGQQDKGKIVDIIKQHFDTSTDTPHSGLACSDVADASVFVPSCSCGSRTRYFLKVQDGCNYFCTYCTIPFARGRSRNGSIASLVEQARQAASGGGKEIVLTGVNIGDFGRTTGESFLDLLRALDAVEGIERYRISSIEPNLLTDDVLRFCAQSRAFMPHFHIPLQSGSDEVLRLMHRRYDTALFYNKVSRARELMPDCFIGVDVIVGTRGETSELFDQAEHFVDSLPISQLHVFSYSERPGTAALRIPHVVRPEEKHERSQRLLAISDRKLHAFYDRFVGTTRPVLLEHSRVAGLYNGFTDNYIKVEYAGQGQDNHLLPLKLIGWNADKKALIAE
ncbi:MAG: tRNA (N(6)-L-threonylcarbamoyladenosine(37)-C(2))-methylthiotransferase MtaB [Bacteroidaceae bacterium]|nr:tRNA (N(6)-L-threonylcarbamoyladenosine(37)-C(2))-methylthiotransferase MtaB [Bacteroidaceae bacterium]